jgi:hypothetical protein
MRGLYQSRLSTSLKTSTGSTVSSGSSGICGADCGRASPRHDIGEAGVIEPRERTSDAVSSGCFEYLMLAVCDGLPSVTAEG